MTQPTDTPTAAVAATASPADDLKARLLTAHMPTDEVPIPGIGTVRVRGLSRAEVLAFDNDVDPATRERVLVSTAMTFPAMSQDEVGVWQTTSSPGEIEKVADKIMVISGLRKESAKEVYQEFEANPGSEFRDVPSPEAGDDGGPAQGGDE